MITRTTKEFSEFCARLNQRSNDGEVYNITDEFHMFYFGTKYYAKTTDDRAGLRGGIVATEHPNQKTDRRLLETPTRCD